MKRILAKPDKDAIIRFYRLANYPDAKPLIDLLKEAQGSLNYSWKNVVQDSDIHRLQGAGQVIDEVIEMFEKAEDWLEELKKK